MQVCGSGFDIEMLVLARPAFRGKHAAAMDILEISIRELVPSFGMFGVLVVDTQVPFCVFFKTVLFDEVVFLLRGGPMLAPRIPLVEPKSPLGD
ncbi:MAG: hypothetical protein QOC72_3716, partial [Methylobacteriaceae bacterium]|nr:hypothetical protein [Methylobacteriaceae bacterium]